MIRIHASYGLKVPGKQEYSSQQYHAAIDIEVPDRDGHQPQAVHSHLASLWQQLKHAVHLQMSGDSPAVREVIHESKPSPETSRQPECSQSGTASDREHGGRGMATKKQIGFLLACARRVWNFTQEQTSQWLLKEYGFELFKLSKSQAGKIIDELQQRLSARA